MVSGRFLGQKRLFEKSRFLAFVSQSEVLAPFLQLFARKRAKNLFLRVRISAKIAKMRFFADFGALKGTKILGFSRFVVEKCDFVFFGGEARFCTGEAREVCAIF